MYSSLYPRLNRSEILNSLIDGNGYFIIDSIPKESIDLVWKFVLQSFGNFFSIECPTVDAMIGIHHSNKYDDAFASLSVYKRTLDASISHELACMPWLSTLCRLLNMYPSDQYNLGYPSFTWRLVRPNTSADFRSIHKDAWFRVALNECSHEHTLGGPLIIDHSLPLQLQTLKVWMALEVEPGSSGLLISPGSQLRRGPSFKIVDKDNLKKPEIDVCDDLETDFPLHHANTQPGSCILFGDQLLHGGAPTKSNRSRVSVEFTLASESQSLYRIYKN